MFPAPFIGPGTLLWAPDGSRVWLRVHPSIFIETWDAVKTSISREAGSSTGVQIRDLREDLSSFEIVGPQGGRLLRRVLRSCRDESNIKKRFFTSLGDPAQLPEGVVAGIKVYDPRLHFPPPVLRDDPPEETHDGILRSANIQPSSELAGSDLWDEDIREELLHPSHKKSDLDQRRHTLSLPGTRLQATESDDRIPLLIIANSQFYTLIFPRGWSNAILQSIVYTATLIGGLEERRAQHREARVPCFPEHFGTTCKAGKEWERQVAAERQRRWNRKPPGKRIDDPTWTPDWADILRFDEEERTNGLVPWLFPPFLKTFIDRPERVINAFRKERGMAPLAEGFAKAAVVHVTVESVGRGSPGDMAAIYSLERSERQLWLQALDGNANAGEVYDDIDEVLRLGEILPDKMALIGYTTTGNFSLSTGHGHALGTITLAAWNGLSAVAKSVGDDGRVLVKYRNNGGKFCRVAELRLV